MLNKSKKSWVITVSVVLLFALMITACGSKSGSGSDKLDQIKKAGVIKVGLMGTYAPYNFLNDNKQIDGFDADIAKDIAQRLGVEVEFAPQDFSGLIPSLKADKIDAIISQVTITDDRKKTVDFSQPYIRNDVKIIVREDNNTIAKLEDFKGKNIGVGLGTNDESYLRDEVLPKVGNFTIKTYDDVITSLQDLDSGRIDGTINNLYALKPIVDKNGFKIKAVGEPIKSDEAGVAVNKGNPELLEAIDKALTDMKADGTYNTIFIKWFGEEPASE